uniref:Uncharacterized protein n=1 Tax=Hemiselmis tepida TaxID=464990 RepID=A0A7S0YVX9_9CRYP|mmetsp:Transcript_24816/g.62942  ORF Transcript_24816/g.62942 Transcript_24816/m.62942 type:complete len:178 (+) Transcript_24816:160-693(+)
MDQDGDVWVKLVQPGVQDSRATRIRYATGGSFIVDDLCKAAKMEFENRLAHLDASQLSVSATRDGPAEDPRTLVSTIAPNADVTLYIHAPAPPREEEEENPEGAADASDRVHGWFSSNSIFFHHVIVLVCLVAACCLQGIFQGGVAAAMFVISAVFSQSCRILVPVHSNYFERIFRS